MANWRASDRQIYHLYCEKRDQRFHFPSTLILVINPLLNRCTFIFPRLALSTFDNLFESNYNTKAEQIESCVTK
jgi:hypothetical protein